MQPNINDILRYLTVNCKAGIQKYSLSVILTPCHSELVSESANLATFEILKKVQDDITDMVDFHPRLCMIVRPAPLLCFLCNDYTS